MEGMLELLSTTDAAVKALNRSSRSQSSVSSRSSSGSKKKSTSEIPDSGIGQTEDRSQKTKTSHSRETEDLDISQHSSDVSTTASDVLIRSTTAAPGEKSILDDVTFQSVDNTSNISKCSKYSFGKENFNSSGPVKVKVSSKLLREIKSPYESPREETNTGDESPKVQNVQPEISLSKSREQNTSVGKRKISTESKASSRGGDTFKTHNGSSDVLKPSSRPNSATSKSSTVSQSGSIVKGPSSKSIKDSKSISQPSLSKPISNNPKDIITLQSTPQRTQSSQPKKDGSVTPEKQKKTGGFPQPVFVERHTPEKVSRDKKIFHSDDDKGSYIEEFCKEQRERQDLVPEKLVTESVETSMNSATSSQPEIVTVPERIVTISTRSSVSSDHSLSDSGQILTVQERLVTVSAAQPMEDEDSSVSHTKEEEEEEKIPPRLPDKFHQYTKHQNGGLKQGSESSGISVMDHPSDPDDIHVEKFRLSEKQQLMKENFTKRLQGGPKKRIVQPRLIGPAAKSTRKENKEPSIQNTEAITAAVAASAAIAATQPFLKAQQELENKMTNILNQIGSLQSDVAPPLKGESESDKVAQLEKQLATVTEQRIQHLEKLQEQQVAMQAKLLSLSRTPQNRAEVPRSKSPTIRSPSWSPPVQRKKEFPPKPIIKTTVQKPGHRDYNEEQFQDHRSPETPKPRTNPPKPLSFEYQNKKQPSTRGILEEILASDASPRRDVPEPTKYEDKDKLRGECVEKSPAVKRAEKLIHDIEEVKDKLQQEVTDGDKTLKEQDEKKLQDMKYDKIKMEQLHGPSPLDPYLLPQQNDLRSPYKSMPGHSKHEVPVPSSYWDAAQVLQQVKENRVTLEANLEAVFRTRQEAEVYALMENLYQEGNNADMLRIRKMVDKKIAILHSQVEREVTDDVIWAELQKKEAPVLIKPTTTGQQKSAPYTQRATARGKVGAKIDTGLSKIKGPSFGPPPSKAVKGKENKPSTTTVFKPPAAKQPKIRSVFEDEAYMTKIYGKASYQNKRTTVKDPYLHYQNVSKPKPDRPPGAPDMSTAHLVKSSKTQTAPGIKQFYFSPTHGTYIPVTSAEHAPIPGQLVPMAVPLGGPRIDSGLTYSAPPPPGPLTTSTPASQPPVSALKNVAVVSVPVVDDLKRPPEPELSKQVLPSVDIDTDISETSPIPKSRPRSASPDKPRSLSPERDNVSLSRASAQYGEVQLRSPQKSPSKSRLEVTFHREEDEETLTDVSGDLNPEDAPGIALPGYHPPSPPPAETRPVFPQQRLLDYNAPVVSEVLAEDIRRRDDLEKRAEEWLQQELLAKMISELCPTEVEEEPPPGLPHFVDEDSIQSEMEDKEQSMFVMDSIGRAGMQLFVDVGQPVNTDLVNSLIREVLVEKVVNMLGQQPSDEKEAEQRVLPKLSATVDEDKMGTTEPSPREYLYSPDQIETPQPTPKATPIASPTRVVSPPVTPELSPPPSTRREIVRVEPPLEPVRLPPQQEPESEISESLDLSEELRILRQKLVIPVTTGSVAEVHEIETPVPTPVPEEEPPQEIKPMSPPPPTPRPVESPPKVVEPPVEVKKVESPKVVQEETIIKKPEKVTEEMEKTPQPWGNPESPRPEENPEYKDEMEPDQPAPMIMQPPESNVTQEDRRSPSPKRQKSPVRQPSPAPSVTESVSESSISDTINQSVSEGQWLLNKSEGEVADFPIDEVTRQRALEKALRLRAEQSMASTLRDTSEIPDESTEFPISEGEFQYNPAIAPEKDPVLLLLSRLQHGPIHPGQLDMTSAQVSDLLDYTGTSTGDLSINQLRASVDRSMGEVRPKKHRKQHASPERDYGKYDYGRQLRSPSPDQVGRQSPSRGRVSPGYHETSGRKSPHSRHEYDEEGRRSPSRGRASPERGYERSHSQGRDSPHRDRQYSRQRDPRDGRYSPQRDPRDGRYSPQRDPRDGQYSPQRDPRDGRYSPQRDQQGRRSPLRSSLESGRKSPLRVSYEMDSEGRDVERYIVETTSTTTKKTTRTPSQSTPSRRTPTRTMTPGGVSLGGSLTSGRRSPVKSALKKPPQATKSPGLPDKSVTMTGPRTYPMPGSDEQRGSQSLSDKGTRAFTPDQMNMEELLQSGYLSQTFSQSSTGRVPSPEHPQRQRQLSPTRLSKEKKSLGMTYSFESEGGAADSFSESELRRLADSDSLKMSVTLPSMDDSEFL